MRGCTVYVRCRTGQAHSEVGLIAGNRAVKIRNAISKLKREIANAGRSECRFPSARFVLGLRGLPIPLPGDQGGIPQDNSRRLRAFARRSATSRRRATAQPFAASRCQSRTRRRVLSHLLVSRGHAANSEVGSPEPAGTWNWRKRAASLDP